jgi:hypothetical protein
MAMLKYVCDGSLMNDILEQFIMHIMSLRLWESVEIKIKMV